MYKSIPTVNGKIVAGSRSIQQFHYFVRKQCAGSIQFRQDGKGEFCKKIVISIYIVERRCTSAQFPDGTHKPCYRLRRIAGHRTIHSGRRESCPVRPGSALFSHDSSSAGRPKR